MKKSLTAAAVLLPAGALTLAAWGYAVHAGREHQGTAARTVSAGDAPVQLWTCGMHPWVVLDHPGTCPICHMRLTPMHAAAGHAPGGPPAVVVDPAVVQDMGVRTAEVTRGPVVLSVRTVGTLDVPEPGLHDVSPKVGGWIRKLYANQDGQHVRAGEPLFELYSPDLIADGGELVGAARAVRALGPTADASVRQSAEALVTSAERKLSLLDVPEAEVRSMADRLVVPTTVTFGSPSGGDVIDEAVVEGSSVQAGQRLMRIEDHRSLWLDLAVYEDQLTPVAVGQAVDATVEGLPGRTFHGSVTFLHPHVDPMTRTLTARATLDNPDGVLRPGMYASAAIRTRPVEAAVQVPREAVIDTGVRQVAFVATGGGHFEPRDVRVGLGGDDGRVQILSGLSPGETVVTSGQFLLDVESRTAEAVDRLRSGAAPEMLQPAAVAATAPAGSEASGTVTVAYCPMKKTDWIQDGAAIHNPYFGTAMPDCGEVRQSLPLPPPSSPLRPVIDRSLMVGRALAADRLDPAAARSLAAAAERLGDPAQADLRRAALGLSTAADVATARAAFRSLSEAVIRTAGGRP